MSSGLRSSASRNCFPPADAVVVDFPDDPLDLRLVYRRHGFEVIGTIQGVGASPPLAPMLRPPR
jgi:hypothetical protein